MQVGRTVFAGASVSLGLIGLVWGAFAFAWQPIPPDLPGYRALAYFVGATLVAAGVGALFARSARAAAIGLAAVYVLFAIPWGVRVVRFPQMFGTWGGLAEQVSLVLAATLILLGMSSPQSAGRYRVASWCIGAYGVCAVVFGFNHFLSLTQTAGMVPQWLPPSPMFWAVATGVFHCAAGIAIMTSIRALLAARLLAGMMLVFEALVWIPSLIASPDSHMVWAGNATDVVLAAAALVVADAIARRSAGEGRSR